MATADPTDVKGVIDTPLSDSDIQNYLDDAAFEAGQAIDHYSQTLSSEEKTQLEKYLAALRIRETKDRATENVSRETASLSYEGSQIGFLRKEVEKRDPSDTLAYQVDSDRYVSSA